MCGWHIRYDVSWIWHGIYCIYLPWQKCTYEYSMRSHGVWAVNEWQQKRKWKRQRDQPSVGNNTNKKYFPPAPITHAHAFAIACSHMLTTHQHQHQRNKYMNIMENGIMRIIRFSIRQLLFFFLFLSFVFVCATYSRIALFYDYCAHVCVCAWARARWSRVPAFFIWLSVLALNRRNGCARRFRQPRRGRSFHFVV